MPTQTTTPVKAARDPWLDNAKMALVTLVVVGHAWTLLPDSGVTAHLYDFLYAQAFGDGVLLNAPQPDALRFMLFSSSNSVSL